MSAVAELPPLLTDDQVAALTGLKVQTLANWRCTMKAGPPFIRLSSRAVRYRRDAVMAWLDENTIDPSGGENQKD